MSHQQRQPQLQKFCGNCLQHIDFQTLASRDKICLIAPYHPFSNGQAERVVQTMKSALKKMAGGDVDTKIALTYSISTIFPIQATGRSPAELLIKRRLRTILDRVHPDLAKMWLKIGESKNKTLRTFHPQESVSNYTIGPSWIPATGPLSYTVRTPK